MATQFMPDTVSGYNTEPRSPTPTTPTRPSKLLAEAGAEGMTLNFAYPTEVSRPYMPDPEKIYEALRTDLEAVGIKVNVKTASWNGGYLDNVTAGKYDAYILGWTGDYDSPFNFIGTFFGNLKENDFGTEAYRGASSSPTTSRPPTPSSTTPSAAPRSRRSTSRSWRSTSRACRSATRRRPSWSVRVSTAWSRAR